MWNRTVARLAVWGALAVAVPAARALQDPHEPYRIVKGVEDAFSVPTPVAVVEVGTFDAATGEFAGLTTIRIEPDEIEEIEIDDVGAGRPRPRPGPLKPKIITPEARVDAVQTQLRFNVRNRQGNFSVTANGVRMSLARDTLTINVGRASRVRWSVSSGSKSFSDSLNIKRPRIIGAGAFTVPALPVAVLYEPVADQRGENRASYATARSIGTSITTTKKTSTSTTRPVFEGLSELRDILEKPLKALNVSPATKAEAKALGAVITAIDTAVGTHSSNTTKGSVVARENTLALRQFVEDGFHTGANDGGPGIGDVIVFMRDAELVWLADDGDVYLALLGHRRIETRAVSFLREHLDDEPSGLPREVIEALLALDPFAAGGPDVALRTPRFVKIEEFGVNGVDVTKTFALDATTTSGTVREEFTTYADDFGKGLLSFTGIGIGETKEIQVTYTDTFKNSESTTESSKASVQLHAEPDELYVVAVYYDRLFGTFAFQSVPTLDEPSVSGVASGPSGEVLAHELVTLTADGQRFTAKTNAKGEYAFYSANLRPGPVRIECAGTVREALAERVSSEPR